MDDKKKELVLEIADYIIRTKKSIRKTAEQFHLSKTTISKYMSEYLPKINKEKYREIQKIIKVSDGTLSEDDIKRVEMEYELYIKGYTLEKIALETGNSYQQVQRDISTRLQKIDKEKMVLAEQVKASNIRSNESTLEEKIENLKLMETEYKLCLQGYSISEIATYLNCSPSSVQRNLALLEVVDKKKYQEVKKKLDQNQLETRIKKSNR